MSYTGCEPREPILLNMCGCVMFVQQAGVIHERIHFGAQ